MWLDAATHLSHLSLVNVLSGCGACLNTLSSFENLPSTISSTSLRMEMRASMNLSSSCLGSDSVGSMSQHLKRRHHVNLRNDNACSNKSTHVEMGHCAVGGWNE
jgi:hypothetical protein